MLKSIFTGLALALLVPSAIAEDQAGTAVQAPAPAAEIVTAKVNGMVCDFCARAVSKVFGKRDEVSSVDVDLDEGHIILTMNAGQTLDDETIQKLIKKSGYAFVSLERSTGA